jgi:hypothetical protein
MEHPQASGTDVVMVYAQTRRVALIGQPPVRDPEFGVAAGGQVPAAAAPVVQHDTAIRSGRISVAGEPRLVARFPDWLAWRAPAPGNLCPPNRATADPV